MKNFQILNSTRCNRTTVAAVRIAVDDYERAVDGIAVSDAPSQTHSVIGEFDKGVDAGASGRVCFSHGSKISDPGRNARKKIIFYFLFSVVFCFTSHKSFIFKQLRSAAGPRPVTRWFSTS